MSFTFTRRAFIMAALSASGLSYASVEEDKSKNCHPRPIEGDDNVFGHDHVMWNQRYDSTILRRDPFLGFLSRPNPRVEACFAMYRITAMALNQIITKNSPYVIQQSKYIKYCDRGIDFEFQIVDAPAEYDDAVNSLKKAFASNLKSRQKKSYAETASIALVSLIQSLTTIEYELHTDFLGMPKTVVQLVKDGKGDCKDFALSRYMIAKALGMKPEHLMMIIYAPTDPTKVGHANLAMYHPGYKEWIVVDGTGRDPATQEHGATIAYQNDSRVLVDKPSLIPLIGVSERGVFEFESFSNIRDTGDDLQYDIVPMIKHSRGKAPFMYVKDAVLKKTQGAGMEPLPNPAPGM